MKLIRPFTVTAASLTSNVAETYPEYAATATYALGAVVIETVGASASHHSYESLVAGNIGNALTDATKWLDLGATNRMAMFDQSNGTQTINATSIDATVAVTGRADGVALLGLDAQTVAVGMSVASASHTNLVLYSDQHSNAAWTATNVTVTEDAAIGPRGTMAADRIVGTGAGGTFLRQDISTASSVIMVMHEIAPFTATTAYIGDFNLGVVGSFDLVSGIATNVAAISVGMTALANGFFKCWVSYAPVSGLPSVVGPGVVFNATLTTGIYVAHSQYEETAAPTANIITTSAAVTSSVSEVYYQTFNLQSDSGITSWYSYFSEEIVFSTDLVLVDLPLYTSPTVEAVISKTGTAKCGNMIVGQGRELGDVVYGARVGIQDYSRKTADDFGNYQLVERSFARRASLKLVVPNTEVDQLHQLLSDYRATPVMWIGTDDFAATWIFGFYKDFAVEIAYTEKSYLTLEIEGLT